MLKKRNFQIDDQRMLRAESVMIMSGFSLDAFNSDDPELNYWKFSLVITPLRTLVPGMGVLIPALSPSEGVELDLDYISSVNSWLVEVVRVTMTTIDVRATFVVIGLLEEDENLVEFARGMTIHAAFKLDAAVVVLVKDSPLHMLCEVAKSKRVRSSEMTFTPAPHLLSLVSPLPISIVEETIDRRVFLNTSPDPVRGGSYRDNPFSSFIPVSPAAGPLRSFGERPRSITSSPMGFARSVDEQPNQLAPIAIGKSFYDLNGVERRVGHSKLSHTDIENVMGLIRLVDPLRLSHFARDFKFSLVEWLDQMTSCSGMEFPDDSPFVSTRGFSKTFHLRIHGNPELMSAFLRGLFSPYSWDKRSLSAFASSSDSPLVVVESSTNEGRRKLAAVVRNIELMCYVHFDPGFKSALEG
jgi:hypothetical protein